MSLKTEDLVAGIKKYPIIVVSVALSVGLVLSRLYRQDGLPVATTLLEERTTVGNRLKLNVVNSAQLAEQRAAVVAANAAVSARLIRPAELANNQQFFYRIESETGTRYKDLKQLPPVPAVKGSTTYVAVPYNLIVEGNYGQLLSYLRRLENSAPFCRVSSATLSRESNDINDPMVNLTLTIELLGQP